MSVDLLLAPFRCTLGIGIPLPFLRRDPSALGLPVILAQTLRQRTRGKPTSALRAHFMLMEVFALHVFPHRAQVRAKERLRASGPETNPERLFPIRDANRIKLVLGHTMFNYEMARDLFVIIEDQRVGVAEDWLARYVKKNGGRILSWTREAGRTIQECADRGTGLALLRYDEQSKPPFAD